MPAHSGSDRDDIVYDVGEGGDALGRRRGGKRMAVEGEDREGGVMGGFSAAVERELARRRADGERLRVVVNEKGRALSETFWGQAWNRHLMSHAHYENRMPKGRSLLRKGRVMDLKVAVGEVRALVAGGRLYEVVVRVARLEAAEVEALRWVCAGRVASAVALLAGELSPEVMEVVCAAEGGLFPGPSEIRVTCSCPDYADLCEHGAAVLYAVGGRLDEQPEELFMLRQVVPGDLFSKDGAGVVAQLTARPSGEGGRSDVLEGVDLGALFGVDLGACDWGS